MEPSKRFLEANARLQQLQTREDEIARQVVAQRAVVHRIREANSQQIVDGGVVDSGKLIEANSRLDELEGALALIRDTHLPAAREQLEAAGREEATREVTEINKLNESDWKVLLRDVLTFIDRLRVIDQRQNRKIELQSAYRGIGGESLLGDMSAASAAGGFQSILFVRLELLTRIPKELRNSAQADEYDRLWQLFYGETSRTNQKAAAELAAAQAAHTRQRQAELVAVGQRDAGADED